MAQESSSSRSQREALAHRRYWSATVRWIVILLCAWSMAGLGAGVLFADRLNAWSLGGFPLGFWFAQQGSMLIFLALIGVYAFVMARLDRRLERELDAARGEAEA